MHILKTISLLVLANCALAQSGLLIPSNPQYTGTLGNQLAPNDRAIVLVGSGAQVSVGGDIVVSANTGVPMLGDAKLEVGGNMTVENGSRLNMFDGRVTDMDEMGGLLVVGTLNNFGTMLLGENTFSRLAGDVSLSPASNTTSLGFLEVTGNFDGRGTFTAGINSDFIASGQVEQLIQFSTIEFPRLTVAGPGVTTIRSEEIFIPEGGQLDLAGGILRVETGTRLFVQDGADVSGGSETSFVDGTLVRAASGREDLFYPVGDGTQYNPITLQDIQAGTGRYVISAQLASPNSIDPLPAADVVGVSSSNMWTLQLQEGEIDSAAIFIDFANEDLSEEAFVNFNPVNAEFIIPVVVAADSLPGEFVSLGTGSLEASDSLTFGLITSEDKIAFSGNTKYIALGRAPIISPNLRYYIPDVFSPSDFRQENRAMRVFGEFIDETADFEFTIFNEFNRQMYTTDSFQEANEVGWDGTFNGVDQPMGTYMWILRATIDEVRYEDRGLFYLVR